MTTDQMFVVGALLLILSIPAIMSAFADGRPPRAAAIVLLVGGVMVVMALNKMPGGLTLTEVPEIFIRVIAQVIR